jgi:hypothetical protein
MVRYRPSASALLVVTLLFCALTQPVVPQPSCGNTGLNAGSVADINLLASYNPYAIDWVGASQFFLGYAVCETTNPIEKFQVDDGEDFEMSSSCRVVDEDVMAVIFGSSPDWRVGPRSTQCNCTFNIPQGSYPRSAKITMYLSTRTGFVGWTYNIHGCKAEMELQKTRLKRNDTFTYTYRVESGRKCPEWECWNAWKKVWVLILVICSAGFLTFFIVLFARWAYVRRRKRLEREAAALGRRNSDAEAQPPMPQRRKKALRPRGKPGSQPAAVVVGESTGNVRNRRPASAPTGGRARQAEDQASPIAHEEVELQVQESAPDAPVQLPPSVSEVPPIPPEPGTARAPSGSAQAEPYVAAQRPRPATAGSAVRVASSRKYEVQEPAAQEPAAAAEQPVAQDPTPPRPGSAGPGPVGQSAAPARGDVDVGLFIDTAAARGAPAAPEPEGPPSGAAHGATSSGQGDGVVDIFVETRSDAN